MGYEEAYALAPEVWKRTACNLRSVEPCRSEENRDGKSKVELHVAGSEWVSARIHPHDFEVGAVGVARRRLQEQINS